MPVQASAAKATVRKRVRKTAEAKDTKKKVTAESS